MDATQVTFGIVDKKVLSQSVGVINPAEPLTIEEDQSIEQALLLLKEHRIGCIVVTNRQGKIVGIFTERDVVLKVVLSDINLSETPVQAVMTPAPHTEKMTTTFAFALNMMSEGGYRHIPIVDEENYPVGIISVKDIVDYIVDALNKDIVQFS